MFNTLSDATVGARGGCIYLHKAKHPYCLTARPQGAGRDERVSPARAGRNPKGVMSMINAVGSPREENFALLRASAGPLSRRQWDGAEESPQRGEN